MNNDLFSIGLTRETVAKLAKLGISTLRGLGTRLNENLDLSRGIETLASGRTIYKIPRIPSVLINQLNFHTGVISIEELLELNPEHSFFNGKPGWRILLTTGLIDLGYDETRGAFLSMESWAIFIRDLRAYRFLITLDGRGQLSDKFKSWFNRAIKGYQYNQDNRKRTLTVKPFPVK